MPMNIARRLTRIAVPATLFAAGAVAVLAAPASTPGTAAHAPISMDRVVNTAVTTDDFSTGDDTRNDGGGSVRNSGTGSTAVNTSAGGGSATLTATQPRTETSTHTRTVTAPRTDDHTTTNSYNRTTSKDSHNERTTRP